MAENGKVGRGDPPANWVSIFGFVITTKADILAATAFLLSLGSLLYQASIWAQGPRPRLYPPDIVYIFFDQYANNRTVTRFAGQLSFLNDSAPNNDAIVERVELVASVGKWSVHEPWLNIAAPRRDGTKFTIDPKASAHPFILQSGAAVSELYSFAPQEAECQQGDSACRPEANFVDDVTFLRALGEGRSLNFTFEIHYAGYDDVQRVGCRVMISPGLVNYLAENSWYAARCAPSPAA